jgi:serine/threonine kinase 16
MEVHNSLSHPSILRLVEHCKNKTSIGTEMWLLYPLYENGTLRDLINRHLDSRVPLEESLILKIFCDICHALQQFHSRSPDPSWAHRDIKPENVLMGECHTPILMDFGSTAPAVVDISTRQAALQLQDLCAEHCSMAYRAPELFDVRSDASIDARTDVWSLGCLLYAMAFGYSPFECEIVPDRSGSGHKVRVVDCSYLRVIGRIEFPEQCTYTSGFTNLISWIMSAEITKRPHVHEVITRVEQLATAAEGGGT